MNHLFRTRLAQFMGVALALFAGSAVAAALAQTPGGDTPKVAVVVAGPAAAQADVVARARAAVAAPQGVHAQLRVPRTSADELGVTHMLAAAGYDAVITVGVDRRVAIAPVAERYPQLRFVTASAREGALERALANAAR
jgi:basic membrane lipoprotein Med (substrate-binding protein (PBP1-ABC) superfamily)